MTVYILNSIIPPKNRKGMLVVSPSNIQEVKEAIDKGAQCFIGHSSTAKLLGIAPNRGEAVPKSGDIAYIVRLRSRPASGQEIEVKPEDLEILKVEYMSIIDFNELYKRIEYLEDLVNKRNQKLFKIENIINNLKNVVSELEDELKYLD
ncbi:MAG: DUF1874 domain-containing protein [Nitrososphaeria archaeon]